ncbi:hypothetical protein WICMUC_000341 [Wickerhamomyces mucosus]|uniref:Sphingoid long-chain base transporter RSB1 n=1 Tax=Wickerhamomyces mucosus TaxID=1378264 RepID=A0A9P8PZH7_9ASCO|nr:hypothetical protein WICMUC_000341 [Wickerhamomyces mucosus]
MTSTAATYLSQITSMESKLSSVEQFLATATDTAQFYSYSEEAEKLMQSLSILQNEQLLATITATATSEIASASSAIAAASQAYSSIVEENNLYNFQPSFGGNLTMAIAMAIFTGLHAVLGGWYRTWGFGVSYFMGCVLEFLGYIGRTLSSHNVDNVNDYLIQFICLTIAPCFIMAGIYYLLGKLIIIHGSQFSILKPRYYSYIFISFDVVSLIIQLVGAVMAGTEMEVNESGDKGTHITVAGLSFQVFSTTAFIIFYIYFIWKIKYLQRSQYQQLEDTDQFDSRFVDIRSSKNFRYYPYIIFLGTILVYVRCIYRVAELSEGWSGYLITHEIYFMILDALMMGLTILIFIVFHPGFVWSRFDITDKKNVPRQSMLRVKRWLCDSKERNSEADREKSFDSAQL